MIKVYNTLTREVEPFNPIDTKTIRWYNCGPTVYDQLHIGHARSAVAFDTIRRYFLFHGFNVRYIMNFTDIDDKMIKKAHEESRSVMEVAEENISYYYRDMGKLNVIEATLHPRAMLHIRHMVKFIQRLIDKGYAYESNGDVYFDIRKSNEYGKLSGQKLKSVLDATEDSTNPNKRFPADFALWKRKKEGEPAWLSPWGEGRPGWHIECSVMSTTYLGNTLDIHSGGQDLIFPHHENEILQSESATEEKFANYWLHNGFVQINSEKMSKSLGNFITLSELYKKYSPNAIRLYILMTHYRQPIDFTEEGLKQAEITAERLFSVLLLSKSYAEDMELSNSLNETEQKLLKSIQNSKETFIEAMNNDFNTSEALAAVFGLEKDVNDYLRNAEIINPSIMNKVDTFFDNFRYVFGLFPKLGEFESLKTIEKLVELLISLRTEFRSQKEWEKSDNIRETLKAAGIVLEDNPKRVLWKLNTLHIVD